MSNGAATGELPGLALWSVRRVDVAGQALGVTTTYDPKQAADMFQLECARIGIGDGAAVYLLRDGRTVDQVVGRVLEADDELVEVEDDDA